MLNFCASLVKVECLVTWSRHGQKPKMVTNPWNMLAMSTEFPASASTDSVLTVSRAMKLGPAQNVDATQLSNPNWNTCPLNHSGLVFWTIFCVFWCFQSKAWLILPANASGIQILTSHGCFLQWIFSRSSAQVNWCKVFVANWRQHLYRIRRKYEPGLDSSKVP